MKLWIRLPSLMVALLFGVIITVGSSPQDKACFAQGPVINPPVHPDKEKKAVQPAQPAAAFDGKPIYREAYEAFRDLHILLADPKERAAWEKEWEHKYDNTDAFKTEEGTDKALQELDYSLKQRFDYYFDKEMTKGEKSQIDASLVGIGATLRLSGMEEIAKTFTKDTKREDADKALLLSDKNRLEIDEPMEGSPAEKAGLKPGDAILEVDGTSVNGLSMKDAVAKVKGKAGTKVKLTIERKDDQGKVSKLEITITRAQITVPVVKYQDFGNGLTYVKLRDFMSKNAIPELNAAFKKSAKGKALILDLRGNPGGSLTTALTMAGMLLNEGPVMVTKSRQGDSVVESEIVLRPDAVLYTEPDGQGGKETSIEQRTKLVIPEDMPIIVLIDEGSASASEIISGILQHNHRAIVIGMPSHGKGVGQAVIAIDSGKRSLHVTTFEFIPGRTPNNWIGVIPDVEVERGKDPKVDPQLEKAKEMAPLMIQQAEQRKAKREEQEKRNREAFEKELQQRNKK